MKPTDTPRTDKKANNWESTDDQWVSAEFARQLERELAELSKWREMIDGEVSTLREELAAERALADRLAALLQRDRDGYGGQVVDPDCDCCDCEYLAPIDEALAAWMEARRDLSEIDRELDACVARSARDWRPLPGDPDEPGDAERLQTETDDQAGDPA